MCTDCRAAKRFAVTVSAWPAVCGAFEFWGGLNHLQDACLNFFPQSGCDHSAPDENLIWFAKCWWILKFLTPDWELSRVRPSEFCLTLCFWCSYTWTGLWATNCCAWRWYYICRISQIWEPSTAKWMKIDQCCHRRKCSFQRCIYYVDNAGVPLLEVSNRSEWEKHAMFE